MYRRSRALDCAGGWGTWRALGQNIITYLLIGALESMCLTAVMIFRSVYVSNQPMIRWKKLHEMFPNLDHVNIQFRMNNFEWYVVWNLGIVIFNKCVSLITPIYVTRLLPSLQLQMQIICLSFGIWSLRNVRKQRVVSASLFDQRRLRIQGNNNSDGVGVQQQQQQHVEGGTSMSNGSYSSRWRKKIDSSVELTLHNKRHQQKYTGYAKVPKSPAPDFNEQDSNMQAV